MINNNTTQAAETITPWQRFINRLSALALMEEMTIERIDALMIEFVDEPETLSALAIERGPHFKRLKSLRDQLRRARRIRG